MHAKLTVNENHYLTEITCMRYVLSQLKEKAAQHTESHHSYEPSVTNSYRTADEVLKDLREIYEDSDKLRNYRQAYIELIQGSERFSDFYIEFCCLFTFLEYGEIQCMDDLRDKISPHLQFSLLSQIVQPDSLSTMKAYLICLNNEQRAVKAAKNWRDANLTTAFTKKDKFFKYVTFEAFISQLIIHSSTSLNAANRRSPIDSHYQADR